MHVFLLVLKAIFLGYLTGIIISIPLGPAGIESIKKTISKGFSEGFTVSLGALSADMTYLILINGGLSSLLSKNKKTEALFWIISGFILSLIGYTSIRNHGNSALFTNLASGNSSLSFPFLSGFLITFSNPMTPSTWLFLSGTVIRAWYYVNRLCYYLFIIFIVLGMITWFAFLNYAALKGIQFFAFSTRKTSALLMIFIVFIGLCFIFFGLFKLIF